MAVIRQKALEIFKDGTVIPAIPLVLDESRKFDEAGQRRLVRYYLASGAGGLAVAVHTTQFEIRLPEYSLLEPVLSVCAQEMSAFEKKTGKTLVRIAGACGPAEQAVKEADLAVKYGYDAVLLSPGGLAELSEVKMVQRTKEVAEIISVIGFYLQTAVGGRPLSFDYWRQVADTENVIGIKSAPFNRYQTLDLVRGAAFSRRSSEVSLYTGNDDNIVIDLLTPYVFEKDGKKIEKRFAGGLLGHWSVWTHTAVSYYKKIKEARKLPQIPAELLPLAQEVTDCNGAFFDVQNHFSGCIAGIHEILRRQGLMKGIWCLNPKETLSPGQEEEIDRVCRAYPHLSDDEFIRQHISEWE